MNFLSRFHALEPREQSVLVGGTLLTIGLLIYFLLWLPLLEAHHNLQTRVTAQQATLTWMQGAAQQIQQLRTTTVDNSTSSALLPTLESSLQTENLAKLTKRLDPKNEHEVRVSIESIRFTELITWLALLQNQYAIQIQHINIISLSTADSVKVQLSLSQ